MSNMSVAIKRFLINQVIRIKRMACSDGPRKPELTAYEKAQIAHLKAQKAILDYKLEKAESPHIKGLLLAQSIHASLRLKEKEDRLRS